MNEPKVLNKGRIFIYTSFALIAFAANSVLNRLALGGNTIDAGSYIGIRLASGTLTLLLLNGIDKRGFKFLKSAFSDLFSKNILPAFYLFTYGVAFSFAYRSLSSGTGCIHIIWNCTNHHAFNGFVKRRTTLHFGMDGFNNSYFGLNLSCFSRFICS